MNFFDNLMAPLNKDHCMLFYYLGLISLLFTVVALVGLLANLFNKKSMSELSNELVSWKKVRMIGSAAMSCAYVASGQFDQYQEKGIFLWDIAAGLSIIKAAGGGYTFKSYPEDQFKVDVIANNNCLRIK